MSISHKIGNDVVKHPFFSFPKWLFQVPFYTFPKKSLTNKQKTLNGLHLQTSSSRNLNCSVVSFPLLHCSRQTAVSQPLYAFSRRDSTKKSLSPTAQKIYKYLRTSEFSKTVTFALKLRRGRMNTKLVAKGLRENDSD